MTPPKALSNSTKTIKLAKAFAERLGGIGSWMDGSFHHVLFVLSSLMSTDTTAAYSEFLLLLTFALSHLRQY